MMKHLASLISQTLVHTGTEGTLQQLWRPAAAAWTRSFACRWDAATPQTVVVEYDPADLEMFITMADALEIAFPSIIIEGNEGAAGAFEVSTGGSPLFSRLALGKVPDMKMLIESITNHIAAPAPTGASRDCT